MGRKERHELRAAYDERRAVDSDANRSKAAAAQKKVSGAELVGEALRSAVKEAFGK